MRKTRLVIQPTRCLHTFGFLLLYVSCPVIGDWGLVQPESAMAQRAIFVEKEGSRTLITDPSKSNYLTTSGGFNQCRPGDQWQTISKHPDQHLNRNAFRRVDNEPFSRTLRNTRMNNRWQSDLNRARSNDRSRDYGTREYRGDRAVFRTEPIRREDGRFERQSRMREAREKSTRSLRAVRSETPRLMMRSEERIENRRGRSLERDNLRRTDQSSMDRVAMRRLITFDEDARHQLKRSSFRRTLENRNTRAQEEPARRSDVREFSIRRDTNREMRASSERMERDFSEQRRAQSFRNDRRDSKEMRNIRDTFQSTRLSARANIRQEQSPENVDMRNIRADVRTMRRQDSRMGRQAERQIDRRREDVSRRYSQRLTRTRDSRIIDGADRRLQREERTPQRNMQFTRKLLDNGNAMEIANKENRRQFRNSLLLRESRAVNLNRRAERADETERRMSQERYETDVQRNSDNRRESKEQISALRRSSSQRVHRNEDARRAADRRVVENRIDVRLKRDVISRRMSVSPTLLKTRRDTIYSSAIRHEDDEAIRQKEGVRRIVAEAITRSHGSGKHEIFFGHKPYSGVENLFLADTGKWGKMKDLAANCVLGAMVLFLTTRGGKVV